MSIHGFHFELKAVGGRDGLYSFYLQRLKPGDPILSFRQCERHTFSMRSDRDVRYCITVQHVEKNENQIHTTGIKNHKFGLGDKTSKSEEPLYHSEVMSIHGFHFELKAVGGRDGLYSFYLQRLKPGDPILSFRQCERHTFSMRSDRDVRYCITVQHVEKNENQIHTTGIKNHKFGLGDKTSKSEEPLYHSEVMSIHGFHFEMKAVGGRDGLYSFYLQRLKPGDPILSFRQCERHTFSMRSDRDVRYCIAEKNENQIPTTGIKNHKYGLGDKTSKSEVVQLTNLKKPIYVQFSVLFPTS